MFGLPESGHGCAIYEYTPFLRVISLSSIGRGLGRAPSCWSRTLRSLQIESASAASLPGRAKALEAFSVTASCRTEIDRMPGDIGTAQRPAAAGARQNVFCGACAGSGAARKIVPGVSNRPR